MKYWFNIVLVVLVFFFVIVQVVIEVKVGMLGCYFFFIFVK